VKPLEQEKKLFNKMIHKSNFSIETAVANCSGAMEADTISKNGRSLKSQKSRGNKMKMINCFIVLISIFSFFTFTSCSEEKDKPENTVDASTMDNTPQDIMDIFDNFEVIDIDIDDIVDIFGLTNDEYEDNSNEYLKSAKASSQTQELSPIEQLRELTKKIADNQIPFTKRTEYAKIYPNQPNGLAYVANGKSDKIHEPWSGATCKEKLAGLDCSGMLYQGALKTGVTIYTGQAVDQAKTENWEKWLKGTKYTHIVAEKEVIKSWDSNDWKTGDIIVFSGGSHIGTIAVLSDGKLAIIHSQGSKDLTCDENKHPKRGPKAMTSDDKNNWDSFIKKVDSRVRFKLKDSYSLSMRCAGASSYAYIFNLSIDITKTGTFEDKVTFKDYDGSINRQTISYSYDTQKKEFIFVARMTDSEVPGGVRIDEFTIPLASLGIPVSSSVSFSGDMYGCEAEFLLKKGFEYNNISLKSQSKGNNCSISFSTK
jgi:hypothetical protein